MFWKKFFFQHCGANPLTPWRHSIVEILTIIQNQN